MKMPSPPRVEQKIDYSCQIVPATLSPNIRDVTTPDLIRRGHGESTIQHVRDIQPLRRCLLVGMRTGLLADQFHLAHIDELSTAKDVSRLVGELRYELELYAPRLQSIRPVPFPNRLKRFPLTSSLKRYYDRSA